MTNLKELEAQCDCGINEKGISGLNLYKLNASNNFNIKDVSFMTNLKGIRSTMENLIIS